MKKPKIVNCKRCKKDFEASKYGVTTRCPGCAKIEIQERHRKWNKPNLYSSPTQHPAIPNKKTKMRAIVKIRQAIGQLSPERSLWLSVIERAILDLGIMDRGHKHYWNSDSFFKNGRAQEVCDMIGLDYTYLLRTMVDKGVMA